jgi:hypothetical protein
MLNMKAAEMLVLSEQSPACQCCISSFIAEYLELVTLKHA